MATNCRLLVVGRAAAYRNARPRPRRYQRREDPVVYAQLKAVLRERGSYGYRRATVLVNRDFGVGYNRKRIQRVMRLTGLALAVQRQDDDRLLERGFCVDGALPPSAGNVITSLSPRRKSSASAVPTSRRALLVPRTPTIRE